MQKLSGKTALITGGNSGIGLATAKLFLAQGARVAITGRNPEALAQAKEILGHEVLTLRCDASKVSDINDAMATLQSGWGKIDVLVVNAAVAGPAPFEFISEEHFDALASVNFKGAFFTIQKALPLLSAQSSVIVTTSISNQIGSPNFSVYAACKAALRSLVQTLALELIGRGVRVNAISPGPITTPMWGKFGLPDEAAQAVRDEVTRKSPSKRFGEAEEVAKAALFLASDDSSYIVGQEIAVDGGMSVL
ncbi:MAG: SDR family oxidoreductase [Burkholderiales bacterium]|jgi:NAD(P)-dependent dehydrogenase (short-subunit alcohol dehydrogenase family)|nr:MAG: SDR family oxidoreductase [Burkholderiales bacterium]